MLPSMIFEQISLEEIDFENEMFRISEKLDYAPLLDSLRAVGQLNPVLLFDVEGSKKIVCGFRRLRALRQLNRPGALARVLTEKAFSAAGIFGFALWDNLSHRSLNPLEKARVLFKLKNAFAVSKSLIVRIYLPLLRLMPNESVLQAHLALHVIHPELRQCMIEDRLTLSSIVSLSEMPYRSQDRIASLMGKIRLSASLQRKVMDLLMDLAATTGTLPGEILDIPGILDVLGDSQMSPYQRGEAVHRILYRRQNPRLSKAQEGFIDKKKSLGLPSSIRIKADPFFEKPGLSVEFEASTADRFRELASALQEVSKTQALEELFWID